MPCLKRMVLGGFRCLRRRHLLVGPVLLSKVAIGVGAFFVAGPVCKLDGRSGTTGAVGVHQRPVDSRFRHGMDSTGLIPGISWNCLLTSSANHT